MAHTTTQQRLIYCFVTAAVIAILITTTLAYLSSRAGQFAPLKSMDTWQQAAAPLGYPVDSGHTPAFDPRFIELPALEKSLTPRPPRMEHPMGSSHGALTYNAQPFWSNNKSRGGHHTGDDINGIGGMNTDLGDPVFSAANGLVVYRGEPSPGWGNTLILAYRATDGSIRQLMYSHLKTTHVSPGELVAIGEKIGTVGTANFNYPAHLHLELRQSTGVWIGKGYVNTTTEHTNAMAEINKHTHSELLYTAPLLIAKRERIQKARDQIFIQTVTPQNR